MDRGFRWLWALAVVGLLAAVAVYTYNLGFIQGVVQSGTAAAAAGTVPAVPMVPLYRPWGFHYGFFPFFPFFFVFFWFLILRGLFWHRAWWGPRWYDRGGVPPAFEEWHRRAHAQPPDSRESK